MKIFIGMSGGVDSSVSAALLKKEGYKVIGVFIRVWEPFDKAQGKPAGFCSWREERREARRAAAHLDIPLLTLDLSREYKKRVVDYFVAEYKAGRTPNPDVMCNKHIKFGVFYNWAMEHGADFVATGHYAQIFKQAPQKTTFYFAQSKDLEKDQSYFLWNLKQNQLPHIIFPVGDKTKNEVRQLAKKFGLPNAEKKDSQGLCFVGQIDFKDFLKSELLGKKGACPEHSRGTVLDEQGNIIGRHDGAMFFTLGERHGFEIFSQTPTAKPYYIVAKDIKKNTLTVSQNNNQGESLMTKVKIEKTNWISLVGPETKFQGRPKLSFGDNLLARVRYRQPLQTCRLAKFDSIKNTAIIIFNQPQLAVPGQSLVLYQDCAQSNLAQKGLICLGGGIIA